MAITIRPKGESYERANPGREPPVWRARVARVLIDCDVIGEGPDRDAALAAAMVEVARSIAAQAQLALSPSSDATAGAEVVPQPSEATALLPTTPDRDDAPADTEARHEHTKKHKKAY